MKAIIAAALVLTSSVAEARCVCRCDQGRMRTICTSALDLSRCFGVCLGDTCLGACSASPPLLEQGLINQEARQSHERINAPPAGIGRQPR
jgi:hypothetical protein